MTRKRKCNSESNSFVAAAEQVCLQPVLEHRQRRGRRRLTSLGRPFHTFAATLLSIALQQCALGATAADVARRKGSRWETRQTENDDVMNSVSITLLACGTAKRRAVVPQTAVAATDRLMEREREEVAGGDESS